MLRRLPVVLLLITSPAWAAWKVADESGIGTVYADTGTITRGGDLSRMSWLLDYSSFQRMVEVGYFSQKASTEFDCAQRRSRALSVSLHPQHMGEGPAIYTDDSPHDWEAVDAGSTAEKLWKIACAQ
jgi:hypothetical protein